MVQRWYHIRENTDGTFTYHDFCSGASGGHAFLFNDHYKHFNSRAEAESYAQSRGAINAYFEKGIKNA
jgi:hypothetical protein